jgi:SpoVK/Ycf46/Vps4 family AAA+-type ATPase
MNLPIDKLTGEHPQPILDPDVQESIEDAIIPLTHGPQWRAWKMNQIRQSPSALLLTGPSGTGKTTIARSLAKRIGTGLLEFSFKDIGGESPGSTARNLTEVFAEAKKAKASIFMDECEGLLWSRTQVNKDSMWMLNVIGTLLTQIEKYPFLVIMATNLPMHLDHALERRIVQVEVGIPSAQTRQALWEAKLPTNFLTITDAQAITLAKKYEFTGAEIENAIFACAKKCIRTKTKPSFKNLVDACGEIRRNATQKNRVTAPQEIPTEKSGTQATSS